MVERGETDLELEMWRRFRKAERKSSTGGGGDAVLPPLHRTTAPPPVDPEAA